MSCLPYSIVAGKKKWQLAYCNTVLYISSLAKVLVLNGDRSHGYGASVSAVSVRRLRNVAFDSATVVLEGPNTQLMFTVAVATGVADDQPQSRSWELDIYIWC
jgi:hypothetical protein